MKSLLLSHSDLSLQDIYTFSSASLSEETGLNELAIKLALDQLSIGFGELADRNPEHFFLTNPVWTKPIIKCSDDLYFCAMPQMFFSFVFPILAELLEGDKAAMKRYQEHRAAFLESEIRELFSAAFPGCEIASGYRWQDGENEYENDLMVRVDSHLILVEAKSHSISWPALRGAPERARRHVREMLLDPSEQSLRLATRVEQAISDHDKREHLLPGFPVSLDRIRTVLRLSVTLEDFATLQSTIHHTKKAGWIPDNHSIAPCILLADLEIVFEILEATPYKIHYLKRRADLEAHFDYQGDELDLLGFYLQTGFNIGEAEFSGDTFILTTMSKSIDEYYSALENGVAKKKPTPKQTEWWIAMLEKIEARDFHQWSDVANVLLGTSFSDQKMVASKFEKIEKNVHKNWRNKNHLCAITMIPHKFKTDAMIVYGFKERYKGERYTRMEGLSSQVFATSHSARCLIIGVNIDKKDYPYSLVAVYWPREA